MSKKIISGWIFLILFSCFALWGQAPEVPVSVRIEPRTIKIGDSALISVEFAIPEGYYQDYTPEFFNFRLKEKNQGFSLGLINYPADDLPKSDSTNEKNKFYGPTTLSAPLKIASPSVTGETTISIVASTQICNEQGVCFLPRRQEASANIIIEPKDGSLTFDADANLLFYLLMAFLGGVLLNIMPCVLPVLSVKVMGLIEQTNVHRQKTGITALIYSLGVIAPLAILALIIIAAQAGGQRLGWGFQFQNYGYIAFMIALTFVFALSFFEVFTVHLSFNQGSVTRKTGAAKTFLSGALVTLLATPCSAPLLAPALGFALSRPPALIVLFFVCVGLGLALPYPLLLLNPKFISKIPKPGPWMVNLRKFLGFVMLAVSFWLLNVLGSQVGYGQALWFVGFLLVLALAIWLLSQSKLKTVKGWLTAFTATLLVLGAAWLFFPTLKPVDEPLAAGSAPTAKVPAGWQPFTPARLAEERAAGKSVFVSFSAEWCLTCAINEKAVLDTQWAEDFFTQNKIVRLYGDLTSPNPELTNFISGLGRSGLPVYAFYGSHSLSPVLLPTILTQTILQENLTRPQLVW